MLHYPTHDINCFLINSRNLAGFLLKSKYYFQLLKLARTLFHKVYPVGLKCDQNHPEIESNKMRDGFLFLLFQLLPEYFINEDKGFMFYRIL